MWPSAWNEAERNGHIRALDEKTGAKICRQVQPYTWSITNISQ